MLTALALDSIGTIFEDYTPDERIKWLQGERITYPKTKKSRKVSFNTDFTVLLLTVLTQIMPCNFDDLSDYSAELSVALQHYYYAVASPGSANKYIRLMGGESGTGVAIPVGMVVGMYVAAIFSDRNMLYALIDSTCACMHMNRRDRDDALMLAFLCYRLALDGYFGYDYMKELIAHKAVPMFAIDAVKSLMAMHDDSDSLSEPFEVVVSDFSMNVSETATYEAMFFMCRVDGSFARDVLPSGPKDQLAEVLTAEAVDVADAAFVYGGICTLSEQNYSLVTKPIREGVPVRRTVEDFFQYIK